MGSKLLRISDRKYVFSRMKHGKNLCEFSCLQGKTTSRNRENPLKTTGKQSAKQGETGRNCIPKVPENPMGGGGAKETGNKSFKLCATTEKTTLQKLRKIQYLLPNNCLNFSAIIGRNYILKVTENLVFIFGKEQGTNTLRTPKKPLISRLICPETGK